MSDFIIKYWIQVLFGGIIAFVAYSARCNVNSLKNYFKNTDKNIANIASDVKELKIGQDDSKRTNRAILKDKLNQKIKYHIIKGNCNLHDREVLGELHTEFKSNLGNGDMDSLVKKVLALPLEEELKKENKE